ncbi:MAG: hypothetical protein Q4D37_01870, partial [Oscillospiraceae bacterium]|nr:hypothetical protein [Oscillospiraceae bacterium]
MDQERKTDPQERDALLREILDDTGRATGKPPQRSVVSHAAETSSVVSHAAPEKKVISHAVEESPLAASAAPELEDSPYPQDADLPEPDWEIGSTQAFQTNAGGKHAAPVKTYSAAETSQLYEDLDGISQQEGTAAPKKK